MHFACHKSCRTSYELKRKRNHKRMLRIYDFCFDNERFQHLNFYANHLMRRVPHFSLKMSHYSQRLEFQARTASLGDKWIVERSWSRRKLIAEKCGNFMGNQIVGKCKFIGEILTAADQHKSLMTFNSKTKTIATRSFGAPPKGYCCGLGPDLAH